MPRPKLPENDPIARVLSDLEQDKLNTIADDPVMCDALKKLLLFAVYYNGTLIPGMPPDPTRNFVLAIANRIEFSNEQLGEQTRAKADAVSMIEQGFGALKNFQTEPEPPKGRNNPAK